MDHSALAGKSLRHGWRSVRSLARLACTGALFSVLAVLIANTQSRPARDELHAEPAVPAILAAFDRYALVGMPADHGLKDLNDLILTLVRDPNFPMKVNDIEIECGNSLYQGLLDGYTSGADVPFREVQKVWRNTTQPPCGRSGFYEVLAPLVRAINRNLPKERALRVLAADPAFDWDRLQSAEDLRQAVLSLRRDTSIASVIEKEVLAKHRKALMLMGTFHLLHGAGATGMIEARHPNSVFVISELGTFEERAANGPSGRFANWPNPAMARVKGTSMGKLGLENFLPAPYIMDQDCNPHHEFTGPLRKPVEELFDAVLYLGPQDLRLWEKIPADIVLDAEYKKELRRRATLSGSPGAADELERQSAERAENPMFQMDAPPISAAMIEQAARDCRERQRKAPPK